jgi:hypothetical protein
MIQEGDAVEVVVVLPRHRQAEWIPATVNFVTDEGFQVTYEGQSRQKFFHGTDRVRGPTVPVKEGKPWVFSI